MMLSPHLLADIRRFLQSVPVYNGEDRAWLVIPKSDGEFKRRILEPIIERLEEEGRLQELKSKNFQTTLERRNS